MSDIFELGLSGGSGAEPVVDETLMRLVTELEVTEDSVKALKERREALSEEIARRAHVTTADVDTEVNLRLTDGRLLTVARGSRYHWDDEILNHMVDSGAVGTRISPEAFEAIEQGIRVSRKKYDKLSPQAKEELAPALTIKPGTLSIKVK